MMLMAVCERQLDVNLTADGKLLPFICKFSFCLCHCAVSFFRLALCSNRGSTRSVYVEDVQIRRLWLLYRDVNTSSGCHFNLQQEVKQEHQHQQQLKGELANDQFDCFLREIGISYFPHGKIGDYKSCTNAQRMPKCTQLAKFLRGKIKKLGMPKGMMELNVSNIYKTNERKVIIVPHQCAG